MIGQPAVMRIVGALAGALLALQASALSAQTVERCTLAPLIQLGRFPSQDGGVRFARIDGGAVTGNVTPIDVQISGCAEQARYRMYLPTPISISNGERQLELWPVVTGVNGARRAPVAIVGHENAIDLEGNPRLQVMFALSRADWGKPIPMGDWAASFPVTFEDR